MHFGRISSGLALLALLGVSACGGGGGSAGGGSMDGVMWPDRGGGMSPELPAAVVTGRVVFRSATGETCCVAVDPKLLSPGDAGSALLILDDLPVGPATVTVAGFSTDFAPAVAGVVDTCSTIPATVGAPCDPVRVAAPAFESAPLPVTIIGGVRTDLGEVDISALPFVYAFSPAQDEAVVSPVQFDFTVVDAVTGIRADSVALEVTFERAEGMPPVFRPITKRVPLQLRECADDSDAPCSAEGDLDLEGFKAVGTMPELPQGEVEARITAENLAQPPRALDFRYPFIVLATPAPTATATPEPDGLGTAQGNADIVAALRSLITATPTPTPTPASGDP